MEKRKYYMHLQLLNKLHECCFKIRMPQLTASLAFASVVGLVGLIRFHGIFGLFDLGGSFCFAFGGCVLTTGILHCCGYFSKGCSKFIESIRQPSILGGEFGRKCFKGLRTFGIRNGPIRVMTYDGMYHVSCGTCSLLVTILVLIGHD